MNLLPLAPWPRADRALLLAAFARDDQRALAAAQDWFAKSNLAQIEYRHHRLIAAVGQRFSGAPELANARGLMQSVSKQLWLRGARVLSRLSPVARDLDRMFVPWMLTGNAVWVVQGDALFRAVERAEILIPAEAFTYVMGRLWDAGFAPHRGVELYGAPDPVVLGTTESGRVVLHSDKNLPAVLAQTNLWDQRMVCTWQGQDFWVPPLPITCHLSSNARGDEGFDLQSMIDVAESQRRLPADIGIDLNTSPRVRRAARWLAKLG